MDLKATLIADHYQHTFEQTYDFWQQRNRLFVMLLGVIAFGAISALRPDDANPLIIAIVSKLFQVEGASSLSSDSNSFVVALLQWVFLSVVFFLMVNLYHRSVFVLRNYAYLGALECELRDILELSSEAAFSRESSFYWSGRPVMLASVKYFYVALLGFLLIAFLSGCLVRDWNGPSSTLFFVDVAFSIAIGIYFFGYARSSFIFDSEDAIVKRAAARNQVHKAAKVDGVA